MSPYPFDLFDYLPDLLDGPLPPWVPSALRALRVALQVVLPYVPSRRRRPPVTVVPRSVAARAVRRRRPRTRPCPGCRRNGGAGGSG
jgi:hypothetical protein